jgi:hypothetical protein
LPLTERERLRVSACARERVVMYEEREYAQNGLTDYIQFYILCVCARARVCVCVCVRERERECVSVCARTLQKLNPKP